MSYLIVLSILISIIIMVFAFLISMRMAVIIDKKETRKNWLVLCGLIALLLSGFSAYAYTISAISEVIVEQAVAVIVFLIGSITTLIGIKILITASRKIKQLKEEVRIYLKCIEENNNCEADSTNAAFVNSQTGLYDKQYLHQKLDEEIVRALRQKVPLFLILFDIDREELPDNILQIVGNVVTSNIRDKIDTGFHYEDNRFAITLPYTTRDQAITIAKRIINGLNTWNAKASVGLVSCIDTGSQTSTELIKIAKIAVSEAKAEGGNRIRLLEKNDFDQTKHSPRKRNKIKHLKLLK